MSARFKGPFFIKRAKVSFVKPRVSEEVHARTRLTRLRLIKEMRAGEWEIWPAVVAQIEQVFRQCDDDDRLVTFTLACLGAYILSLDCEFNRSGGEFYRLPRIPIDFGKERASDVEWIAVRDWMGHLLEEMPFDKKLPLPDDVLASFALMCNEERIFALEHEYAKAVERAQ